jgi:hypothetical protein
MATKIEHPSHYNENKKMETWDVIERFLSDEEFKGYLKGNVLKYLHRHEQKDGPADLDKAIEYIKKLKEFQHGEPSEK